MRCDRVQAFVRETVTPETQEAARAAAEQQAEKARRASCSLDEARRAPDAPPTTAAACLVRMGHACMQITAIRHTVNVCPPLSVPYPCMRGRCRRSRPLHWISIAHASSCTPTADWSSQPVHSPTTFTVSVCL